MTALRFIPLPTHTALEMFLGLALGAAPLALGLSTAAAFTAVILGALIVGLALQALDVDGNGTFHLAAHHAADVGIAIGLGLAAPVLSSTGDATGAALFAAAGGLQFVLTLATRYTAR